MKSPSVPRETYDTVTIRGGNGVDLVLELTPQVCMNIMTGRYGQVLKIWRSLKRQSLGRGRGQYKPADTPPGSAGVSGKAVR